MKWCDWKKFCVWGGGGGEGQLYECDKKGLGRTTEEQKW